METILKLKLLIMYIYYRYDHMITLVHRDILTSIFRHFDRGTAALARFVCKRWWCLIPPYNDKDGPVTCTEYVGNYGTLIWARAKGCSLGPHIFIRAAMQADVRTLDFLTQENGPCFNRTIHYATNRDDPIPIMEWFLSHGYNDSSPAYEYCAKRGSLDVMKWLHSNNIPIPPYHHEALMFSIINANISIDRKKEILNWCNSVNAVRTPNLNVYAAEFGNIEMFEYLTNTYRLSNEESDRLVCYHAARGGSLEMLQHVRSKSYPWNEDVCNCAAGFGYFSMLKWALENGCPFNGLTCAYAVASDSPNILEMLNLLYNRNYEIGNSTADQMFYNAIALRYPVSLQVITWISEHQERWVQPCEPEYLGPSNIDLETLQYINSRGYALNSNLYLHPVHRDDFPMMEWLYSKGIPLPDNICDIAAAARSLAVLKWARAHGCVYTDPFYCTCKRMFRWALEDGCPNIQDEFP